MAGSDWPDDWLDKVQTSGVAPASASRGFNAQDVALQELATAFAGELRKLTPIFRGESGDSCRSIAASLQSVGKELSAIGQKSDL